MILSVTDICIFTRSYYEDRELLSNLYKSIQKFVPNWGDVVLVIEEKDLEAIKPYIPQWVRIEVEESFAPGTIQHKYTKLTADFYTDKKYIFHIDSDSIFIKSPSIDDLFINNKPILEYSSYKYLLDFQNSPENISELKEYCIEVILPRLLREDLKSNLKIEDVGDVNNWLFENFDTWFKGWIESYFDIWFKDWFTSWKKKFGMDIWREGTEYAIGREVEFEFSRRPEKLYPRELYCLARKILEDLHGISLKEFISSRIGKQEDIVRSELYFSDLNYLGAVLFYYLHDEITWIDVENLGYEYRPRFVEQFISYDVVSGGAKCKDYRTFIAKTLD
jgi:hypothetical protein